MRCREGNSVGTELGGRALPVSPRYQWREPRVTPWVLSLFVTGAIARRVAEPTLDRIVPDPFHPHRVGDVAEAVRRAAIAEGVTR